MSGGLAFSMRKSLSFHFVREEGGQKKFEYF
jgi:hypothetical protein